MESALGRGISLWYGEPGAFRELMRNGMRRDHSWSRAGQDYLNVYEYVRHK